jgi:hypothetical protein
MNAPVFDVRCFDCGPSGLPLETVYRLRISSGERIVLCARHAWKRVPRDFAWQPPAPCEGACGGATIVVRSTTISGRALCSPGCGDAARRARQEAARAAARDARPGFSERECEGCGSPFNPTQHNQRTHSPGSACRTAAWRRRVATDELLLPLRKRANLGSPKLCEWCPRCRERAIPNDRGLCMWCDTPTRPLTAQEWGRDRDVAVAA